MVSPEEAGTGSLGTRGLGLAEKGGGEGERYKEGERERRGEEGGRKGERGKWGGTEKERETSFLELSWMYLSLFLLLSLCLCGLPGDLVFSRGTAGFGVPRTNLSPPPSFF